MDVTQLAFGIGLGGQTMKNLRRLACKFDLDQSERKSSHVNASAHKAWPNEVASRPKFSTCVYLRLRLARALDSSDPNQVGDSENLVVVIVTRLFIPARTRIKRDRITGNSFIESEVTIVAGDLHVRVEISRLLNDR